MATKDRNDNQPKNTDEASPRSVSRRALLKGTVTAMPAVLTLHSGAALARSSSMISTAAGGSTDAYGRTLCLDTDSVEAADGSGRLFDLGEPAYGRVSAIRDRNYRRAPHRRAERVSETRMCESGGTYYYRSGSSWYGRRWNQVEVKKGVLVSATALSSFAGSIVVTDL